jgi:hypothetical protein
MIHQTWFVEFLFASHVARICYGGLLTMPQHDQNIMDVQETQEYEFQHNEGTKKRSSQTTGLSSKQDPNTPQGHKKRKEKTK